MTDDNGVTTLYRFVEHGGREFALGFTFFVGTKTVRSCWYVDAHYKRVSLGHPDTLVAAYHIMPTTDRPAVRVLMQRTNPAARSIRVTLDLRGGDIVSQDTYLEGHEDWALRNAVNHITRQSGETFASVNAYIRDNPTRLRVE